MCQTQALSQLPAILAFTVTSYGRLVPRHVTLSESSRSSAAAQDLYVSNYNILIYKVLPYRMIQYRGSKGTKNAFDQVMMQFSSTDTIWMHIHPGRMRAPNSGWFGFSERKE